jgi:hypothetical protein
MRRYQNSAASSASGQRGGPRRFLMRQRGGARRRDRLRCPDGQGQQVADNDFEQGRPFEARKTPAATKAASAPICQVNSKRTQPALAVARSIVAMRRSRRRAQVEPMARAGPDGKADEQAKDLRRRNLEFDRSIGPPERSAALRGLRERRRGGACRRAGR